MPRGKLALPESDGEAIRLFAEHDIIQVRRSQSTGRILEVDHVEFGWMKPEAMYRLKKLKEMQPLLEKVVEGGYRAKAAMWGTETGLTVLGSGLKLPAGMAFISGAIAASFIHRALGRPMEAALDIASIFLPFGEAWLIYSGAVTVVVGAETLVETSIKAASIASTAVVLGITVAVDFWQNLFDQLGF